MFDVSSRAKLSVSALAERKIASARPRKYGLLLRAEEEMLLYGQALARSDQGRHLSSLKSASRLAKGLTAAGVGIASTAIIGFYWN